MNFPFDENIQYLKGVGKKRAELLNKLGVSTFGTLIRFYPAGYTDWSQVYSIKDAPADEICCVRAIISKPVRESFIRKGMTLYKTEAVDNTGKLKITLFNSKFSAQKLSMGEEFVFRGQFSGSGSIREISSPDFKSAENCNEIYPVYHLTEGITNKLVTDLVSQLLEKADDIDDPIPDWITAKYRLCSLSYALKNIHRPSSENALKQARRRLIFEELLYLQIGLMMLKGRNKNPTNMIVENDDISDFLSSLSFTPTNAQLRCINEALADMKSGSPMSRLLQGDVGSGKTLVAAALCLAAARNKIQSAIMAPTEILAEQHFKTFSNFFKDSGLTVRLITGSTTKKNKTEIYESLANGQTDIVIGTHALITDCVEFKQLGLVITDEQHRFGVAQRSVLASKGDNPHILVMSATPIPRTLALMIYGDLDISIIDELPPGRTLVETYSINSKKRVRALNYIKRHIDEGQQAYIVCPLIEENETSMTAAESYCDDLRNGEMAGYKVALLHGRMKSAEKEAVMRDFAEGLTDVLVSTTVIEVGVDVPNAVIMMIENAERFGLSQLHQLRGRVGRGKYQSTCILVSDAQNETAIERLKTMCETCNGFEIAEKDLKLRGPGDFFGARQHGLPELKIADMVNDAAVVKAAQETAAEIVNADPTLQLPENSGLNSEIRRLFNNLEQFGLN